MHRPSTFGRANESARHAIRSKPLDPRRARPGDHALGCRGAIAPSHEESFMTNTQRLWRWLGLIFVLSFGALGYLGWQIYLTAPPIPKAVVSTEGEVIFTGEQIQAGQQAWLSAGGQQLGTVWGHGSYVAPDWSADWLHREATTLQAIRKAQQTPASGTLSAGDNAAIDMALKTEMRRNSYDELSGQIT